MNTKTNTVTLTEEELKAVELLRKEKAKIAVRVAEEEAEALKSRQETIRKTMAEQICYNEAIERAMVKLDKAYPNKWRLVYKEWHIGDMCGLEITPPSLITIQKVNDDRIIITAKERFISSDSWGFRKHSAGIQYQYECPGDYNNRFYKNVVTIAKKVEEAIEQRAATVRREKAERDLKVRAVEFLSGEYPDATVGYRESGYRIGGGNRSQWIAEDVYDIAFPNGVVVVAKAYDDKKEESGLKVTIKTVNVTEVSENKLDLIKRLGAL